MAKLTQGEAKRLQTGRFQDDTGPALNRNRNSIAF
jgi:hypothetical protein